MDTKRLILFVIFSFSLMLLWDSFTKQSADLDQSVNVDDQSVNVDASLPKPSTSLIAKNNLPQTASQFSLSAGLPIKVNTDLLSLTINTSGGDIRELKFNNHQAEDSQGKYILMTDVGNPLFYVAQSGLLGEGLPTHKSKFMSAQQSYQMNSDKLIVPLIYENSEVMVKKIYEFNF